MIKPNKHQHTSIKQGREYRNELQTEMETLLHNELDKLNLFDNLEIINYDQIFARLIQNQISNQVKDKEPKIQQIFQNSLWQTNFTIQCLNSMQKVYDLHVLIRQLLTLSEGYFNVEKTSYIEIDKLHKFQGYFIHTYENYLITFEVGVQAFQFQNKFKIKHVITFIDLKTIDSINIRISQFTKIQPYETIKKCFYLQQVKSGLIYYLLKYKTNQIQNIKWIPNEFCDQNQVDQIKHQQTQEEIIKQNQLILNQYAPFPQALLILNILTQNPDFKYKTTEQQRQVIGTKFSSISIGRSGTGKTLSQILRIFLTELNFKRKLKLYGVEGSQILLNSNSQGNTGLHQIYTTLNPVLIGEVRRYYFQLGNIVAKFLLKGKTNNQKMQNQTPLHIQSILADQLMDATMQNENHKYKNINPSQDRKEIDNISKLSDLKDNDFPGFLTIQKLLLMIDSSLSKPFFKNEQFQNSFKRTGRAGWDDEQAININLSLKNMITLSDNKHFSNQPKLNVSSSTNFNKTIQIIQVDYRYFMTRFWPKIKKTHPQTEDNTGFMNLVWTQIYSNIKGSQYSHIYPDNAVPKCIYLRQNKDIYEQSTLNSIYDYYLQYEQWKKEKQLFDQMDLVNYLINQIDAGEYIGTPIHYLTVDEIQDLPHALIELLSKITEQSLQLCGDTAQNIVQGIGFRFQDLKTIFKNQVQAGETKFIKFDSYQLTVNFRAHNNLLQLANNVVSLLEIFFPKSIDRLQKEVSNFPGPKPFLIESQDENELISLLRKQFNNKSHEQIEFGCNQVILVKNDEAKASIPLPLQNALILTVYESKGLEFDDVILYNYFSDNSLSKDKWNIINNLFIEETMQDLQTYTDHQQSEQSKDCSIITLKYNNSILVRKLRIKPSFRAFDLSNFNDLCAELKMLYVAITRPKKRLIIFDNDISRREAIQALWDQLGLINMDDKQFIEFTPQRDENGDVPKQEWFEVGHRMFGNKYYEQAAKCFKMAGVDTEFIKSQAYANATKAQQMQYEYEQKYADCQKYNNKQKEYFKTNYLIKFQDAAECFEKIQIYKMSGDCYFSGENYENALIQYIKCQYWVEAAECAQKIQKYLISSILFFKAEIYDLGLKMIENTNQTIYIMSALLICRQNISDDSMEKSLCKYFPAYVKLLQKGLDKKGQIQIQLKINEDIGIIAEHCQDYEQQFKTILFYFDQFQIQITNLEDFIRELIQSIQDFSLYFLHLIQKQNINYDIIKYQTTIEQKKNSIALQEFVFDILDYFKLRLVQKFVSDKNNQHEKMAISQLFDESILYQEQNSNIQQLLNQISEVKKNAFELVTSIPKIGQHVFLYFNLLALGYEEQMKYQLVSRIQSKKKSSMNFLLLKSTLQNVFSLQSELQEVCLLFRNFNLPLNFQFISRSPEQHKLFELYQEIIQQKNVQFTLEEFRNKLAELHHQNLYIDINADCKLLGDSMKNFIENFQNLNSLQIKYLVASSYIINLIQQCNNGNHPLLNQLLHLDQLLVEQFMVFILMCAKVLKYNVCIRQQKLAFQAIGLLFGFQIPTTNASRYFGQSYVFITKSSPFFKEQGSVNTFCVSIDKSVYIMKSSFVIQKVRKYFCQFLSEYSRKYVELQVNRDQSFLFSYYEQTVKQNKNHQNQLINIADKHYTFLLEKLVQFIIKIKQYQIDHHQIEYTQEIVDIYLDYALSYFKKATIISDIHYQHKMLYRGFQISNIVQTQRYSNYILQHLQKCRPSQNSYYQTCDNYIQFLQASSHYYSIYQVKRVMKYFSYLFKNGFHDIYLKDLFLICLNIIFTYKSIQKPNHQQIKVMLPSTMMILPQIRQNDIFTIQVEDFDTQRIDFESIINSFFDLLIDYYEIKKSDFVQIYLILCTLTLNIKINYFSLQDRIYRYVCFKKKQKNKILMENLLSLIQLKHFSKQTKCQSIIDSLGLKYSGLHFIQKKGMLFYESYENINSYVQYNLSKTTISDQKFENMILEQTDISMKFSYPYIGNRLILSLALNKMEKPLYNSEKLQEPQFIIIYKLIDQNRIKLIELLYSKYIERSIHYHSVSDDIRQLNALEDSVDCTIFSSNFIINIESVIHRLKTQSKKIEEWIYLKKQEKQQQQENKKFQLNQKAHQENQISIN